MLDEDPNSVPAEAPTNGWPVDVIPSSFEMLSLTAREFLRRPEKVIRLGIHAVRSMATSTGNPGLAILGEALAQPLPGPLGRALRSRLRGDRFAKDDLPDLSSVSAPRTSFNASIGRTDVSPTQRFRWTTLARSAGRSMSHSTTS